MKKLTTANFDIELQQCEVPILVEFSSPNCGPCKKLQAVIEEYEKEVQGNIVFGSIDVSDNIEIAARYGIMATPSLILFKGGETKWQYSGFIPKEKIKKHIKAVLV